MPMRENHHMNHPVNPMSRPRRWEPDELRILETLASSGFAPRVIAMRLGRTTRAVRRRLERNRRSEPLARPDPAGPAGRQRLALVSSSSHPSHPAAR